MPALPRPGRQEYRETVLNIFIVLITVIKDMKRPTRNYRSQMSTESKLSLLYLEFFSLNQTSIPTM